MRPFVVINCFLAALGCASDNPEFVPGAYLVEFQDASDDNTFKSNLQLNRLVASPRLSTTSDVFRGASYQFDPNELGTDPLKRLSTLPSVKQVWPVRVIPRPSDEIIWQGSDPATIPVDIKKQIFQSDNDTAFYPHVLTQVDKLHAEDVFGQGIKIGIVDDGVDYKHAALGGCFGSGCLVSRGYDHVGDDYSALRNDDPSPDPDPYAECEGHGTHVAGIIAAQKNQYGFTGAAPKVSLGMYRVFSCFGSTSTDIVAAGFNKAYEDGNDIITVSLGHSSGWPEDPLAVIAQRITEKGIIITISQGNSGAYGPFQAGSPASGKGVTAVASASNQEIPRVLFNATYTVNNGSMQPFGWGFGDPDDWGNFSLPLYVGNAQGNDSFFSCDEFANATDLTGYVVLIRAVSNCADGYKAWFAVEKGARHALFYTTSSEATGFIDATSGRESPDAAGIVPRATALNWIEHWQNGETVTVHITDPQYAQQYVDSVENAGGGFLSPFSSWGPTWELGLKPDVTAPGGYILSTYPDALGSYAVLSGTSMSTPLTAGIIALLLEARGKTSANELQNVVASTAKPIRILNGTEPLSNLAPVSQQGSGMTQAWNAAQTTTLLSVDKLALNDTEHFLESQEIAIKNTGSEEVTYMFSHQPAFTVYTLLAGSNIISEADQLTVSEQYAKVTFSSSNISIPSGGETVVSLSFTPPSGLDERRLPAYSGYISIEGSNGEELSVPYLGIAGVMREAEIVQNVYLGSQNRNPTYHVDPFTEFVFPKDVNATEPPPNVTYHAPWIVADLVLGTAIFDIHIWSVTGGDPTTNTTGALDRNFGTIFGGYPFTYLPVYYSWLEIWDGRLENGTRVPAGNYTFVARALRIFGDPAAEEGWDEERTFDFSVRYA